MKPSSGLYVELRVSCVTGLMVVVLVAEDDDSDVEGAEHLWLIVVVNGVIIGSAALIGLSGFFCITLCYNMTSSFSKCPTCRFHMMHTYDVRRCVMMYVT